MVYLLTFVIIASPIILYFETPFFLKWLAQENILFTTVKEGTCKAIMRGEAFDHFIMSFAGYHLNDPSKDWYKQSYEQETGEDEVKMKIAVPIPDWEVVWHGKGNKKGFAEHNNDFYDERSPWKWLDLHLKKLGLYWVGWPWSMSVYVYQFEWNETITDKDSGEEKIFPRATPTDFIYVADFPYAIQTIGAETADCLPTDELTLVTIAVRNPYRALFSGEDWMRRINAAINRHVRTFVGSHEYQGLISPRSKNKGDGKSAVGMEPKEVEKYWQGFSLPIIALNYKLPDDKEGHIPSGLKGRYGIEIRTAELQTMDLSKNGREELQRATTKKYVAQQEADAKRLGGKADADVIEMKGVSEAAALTSRLTVATNHGELGALLLQLDAMQAAGGAGSSKIIWANNPFGDLLPELKQFNRRNRRNKPVAQKGG